MHVDLTRFRRKAVKEWGEGLPEAGAERGVEVTDACKGILLSISSYIDWSEATPSSRTFCFLKTVASHTAVLASLLGTDDIEMEDVLDFAENGLDPEVSNDKTLCLFGIVEVASWIMRGYFCEDPIIITGTEEDGEELSPGEADIAEIFAYLHLIMQHEGKTLSDLLG
jgi:hypothetical protein